MSADLASGGREHPAGRADAPPARTTYLHLGALRHAAPTLALVSLVAAGAIYGISAAAPDVYEATALVAAQPADAVSGSVTADVLKREIETSRALVRTPQILTASAQQIPGATADQLADDVDAALEPDANIIRISAKDEQRAAAAQAANVVANTFVAIRGGVIRAQLHATAVDVRRQLTRVQADPQQQQAAIALRRRIGQLVVSEATAGRDLVLASSATAPTEPIASHGLRNAIIAFVVALLLGVAVVVARECWAPRARDTRQLRDLLAAPVLAEIPHNPGRRGRARGTAASEEHGGYQALGTALESTGETGAPRIVVVTSSSDGDGKTSVTANLGRALHHAGHSVLLIDGDMRRPALHTVFGARGTPGFGELLEQLVSSNGSSSAGLPAGMIAVVGGDEDDGPSLSIIAAGEPRDRGTLLTRPAVQALVARLRRLPFDYVVIDAPTLPRSADAQVLVPAADTVLVVARLHSTRVARIRDALETLDRLQVVPAGFVAVGSVPESDAGRQRGDRGEAAKQ